MAKNNELKTAWKTKQLEFLLYIGEKFEEFRKDTGKSSLCDITLGMLDAFVVALSDQIQRANFLTFLPLPSYLYLSEEEQNRESWKKINFNKKTWGVRYAEKISSLYDIKISGNLIEVLNGAVSFLSFYDFEGCASSLTALPGGFKTRVIRAFEHAKSHTDYQEGYRKQETEEDRSADEQQQRRPSEKEILEPMDLNLLIGFYVDSPVPKGGDSKNPFGLHMRNVVADIGLAIDDLGVTTEEFTAAIGNIDVESFVTRTGLYRDEDGTIHVRLAYGHDDTIDISPWVGNISSS